MDCPRILGPWDVAAKLLQHLDEQSQNSTLIGLTVKVWINTEGIALDKRGRKSGDHLVTRR